MKKKKYTSPYTALIAINTRYGTMIALSPENGNPDEIGAKDGSSVWDFEEEENQ